MQELKIKFVEGNKAPRYNASVCQLFVKQSIITEKGMESDLPLIDFQLTDEFGREYYMAISGRLINMLSASIRGVNMRNHGIEEP